MARPVKEISRDKRASVRLDYDEYSMLLDIQSETGEDFSEILRDSLRFYYNYFKAIRSE